MISRRGSTCGLFLLELESQWMGRGLAQQCLACPALWASSVFQSVGIDSGAAPAGGNCIGVVTVSCDSGLCRGLGICTPCTLVLPSFAGNTMDTLCCWESEVVAEGVCLRPPPSPLRLASVVPCPLPPSPPRPPGTFTQRS